MCHNVGIEPGWTSGAQRTAQRKDFELILIVKWKLDVPRDTIWL